MHSLLPGQHLIYISLDRIDLSIVDDQTVGVGPVPAGHGIGGETGMNNGDG